MKLLITKKAQSAQFPCGKLRINISKGFLLPSVLMLGLGIGIVVSYTLTVVASNSNSLNFQTFDSLASRAADAGIAKILSCIRDPKTNTETELLACSQDTCSTNSNETVYTDTDNNLTASFCLSAPVRPNQQTMIISSTGKIITNAKTVATRIAKGLVKATYNPPYTVTTTSTSTVNVTEYAKFNGVSMGWATTCAIGQFPSAPVDDSPDAYCWGWNGGTTGGAVGNIYTTTGTNIANSTFVPNTVKVDSPSGNFSKGKVTRLSVGTNHACAIRDSNVFDTDYGLVTSTTDVYCWGSNDKYQLGCNYWCPYRPNSNSHYPVRIFEYAWNAGLGVIDVMAYNNFSCALYSTRELSCWGAFPAGQYGTNQISSYAVAPYNYDASQSLALQNVSNKTIKSLARFKNDSNHPCVIMTDNTNYCWGDTSNGQLGIGSVYPGYTVLTPRADANGGWAVNTVAVQVTDSMLAPANKLPESNHNCIISVQAPDTNLLCLGTNNYGQVGNGTTTNVAYYTEVPLPKPFNTYSSLQTSTTTTTMPSSITYLGNMQF